MPARIRSTQRQMQDFFSVKKPINSRTNKLLKKIEKIFTLVKQLAYLLPVIGKKTADTAKKAIATIRTVQTSNLTTWGNLPLFHTRKNIGNITRNSRVSAR